MRNLLNFLLRYNNIIVFLILESISISFIISGNEYQNSRMVRGMQSLTRGFEERISNMRSYMRLREINSDLARENSELMNRIDRMTKKEGHSFISVKDTLYNQQYQYISAEVVDNSVNRQKNYFTLDKGRLQGVGIDMAVADGDNVAGVIVGCSDNYSVALSLLNLDFRVSARIKSNGYFGSLSWDGHNYRHAVLNEIPQNISVNVGDTVETTGYSAIFPEGLLVGTVSSVKNSGSDFYRITVELATDFKKLHYVSIIGNMKKTERVKLESQFK